LYHEFGHQHRSDRAIELPMQGVVVIDKPTGPTSHDLVAQLRRSLKTRRVGHAGTLDPLASGLLLLAVGEATKLVPYLTLGVKTYEATFLFGSETESLDRGSEVSRTLALTPQFAQELEQLGPSLEAALEQERQRSHQVPPNVSAIHVDGERAHARVRRGESFALPERPVQVHALTVLGSTSSTLHVRMVVSKGYYVRALARDLAARLGTIGMVQALRRTHSGGFDLSLASSVNAPTLLSLEQAARVCLPSYTLTEQGLVQARHGKALQAEHFHEVHDGDQAWFSEAGALIAVGAVHEGVGRVLRGFTSSYSES
jgi:tRNA pseudouridine55 synthase